MRLSTPVVLVLPFSLLACPSGKPGDDTGEQAACLPFAPSNLPEDIACEAAEELVISSENCSGYTDLCFDTDNGIVGYEAFSDRCFGTCEDMEFGFQVVEQSDLTEIAVFTARSIRVDPTIRLYVKGQRPLALVANESIELLGSLIATPEDLDMNQAHGGGFSGPENSTPIAGAGPGGGGAGNETGIGGGGGGHCGAGGAGGNADDSTGLAGLSNGNSAIVPLRGGSSGATQGTLSTAGGGGGAIQLVAGQSIQITDLGSIHVGGGGGERWAGGGGAGGAILLEAPSVSMAGTLAANGGGGGGGGSAAWHGETAQGNSIAAAGGIADENDGCCVGGSGSALSTTQGSSGESGENDSGGGGGAGWIRINTTKGEGEITGTLSPEAGDCASEGVVSPLEE